MSIDTDINPTVRQRHYKIVRFYQDDERDSEVIKTGLSLIEARAWCNDPETSSRTAVHPEAVARTEAFGPWFDGYEEQ